ncbi:ankyrin repeat-containing domain protein [Mycena vitilis]|nr:ankyrin repeat-containing domain protein [Mycena vitilis]
MSKDYFEELPPELIALLPPSLPIASLNALALTCRRLHEILQPELESRITPQLARKLLLWAAASKPHIVKKLLAPPHSMHPDPGNGAPMYWCETPLHVAAKAGNTQITNLLLDAGADPAAEWDQDEFQPLHLATMNKDLDMMKLLLDRGSPVDASFGCDGASESALHYACAIGNLDMVRLLLERGASIEHRGHYGSALGFAVHRQKLDVVKFLLVKGADATLTVPLFILLDGGPPQPHHANLLYNAMQLRHPVSDRFRRPRAPVGRWEGLPLSRGTKELMALLLAHGASKETAMQTITSHLAPLAKAAQHSEEEFLEVVSGMFKDAEDAIPDVMRVEQESLNRVKEYSSVCTFTNL